MPGLDDLMEKTPDELKVDNAPELEEGVFTDPSGSNNNIDEGIDNVQENDREIETDDEIQEESTQIDEDSNENSYDANKESEKYEEDNIETDEESNKEIDENDEPIIVNFGSGEIQVNDLEELKTIASKALKDKTKFDQYKDDIALLEGIKEQGLSEKDLYLLVEARKGNKKAIAKLLKETGIDIYDIDPDDEEVDNYEPNEYKIDPRIVETKAIIDNLKKDQQVFTKFNNLLTNDFDEQSRQQVFQDPTLLEFIGESIKSGLYEKIAPIYMKKKLLGESPVTAFISAYDEYNKSIQDTQINQIKQNAQVNKTKAEKRRKASAGVKNSVKSTKKKPIDFNTMSDEEFEEYYKNLVGF